MGYKAIGKRIHKAREEAGLSQEELAARIGCSQSTLSNYELGKRRLYLAQLESISRVLGKPLTYFLKEDYDPPEAPAKENYTQEDPDLEEIASLAAKLSNEERRQVAEYIRFILWKRGKPE